MRTGLLIIFCTLMMTGCRNRNRIPSGVIPPPKMQAILWDMMRADMFLVDFIFRKDSALDKRTEREKMYGQVFAIHQTNKEQFGESFSFYRSHPVLFRAIMDSIGRPKNEAPTRMVD